MVDRRTINTLRKDEVMKHIIQSAIFIMIIVFLAGNSDHAACQSVADTASDEMKLIRNNDEKMGHRIDQLEKAVDDILWFQRVGSVAFIDKILMTGPPRKKEKNPTGLGAGNPVKFWSYVFIPKGIDVDKKYPLIVFPHGGVHGDFTTYHTHIVKELIYQQYIIVAADYRGSTGYGKAFYEKIDYGGLEIDDVNASRDYMLENYDMVDKNRVGIIGWSHGGLIALMSIFDHPEDYNVAFAGVPVSDLIARMGYYDDEYRDQFSADYHIGKTAMQDVEEYRRRSPAWNAQKLKTPLLIHTNTIDEDVNVLEVEHLIQALKAEGKKFDYEIFQNVPGGHSFDRLDTKTAREIRLKIYKFLAVYLKPAKPFSSVRDIDRAVYQ
jgi:dipeptidyl aminopeptidase/acylaminoacyl peptidase